MDFTLSPEVEDFRQRIRAFVADTILPLESDPASFDEHENITEDLLASMRDKAKAAGVERVAFDRSGFKYHGRVKALAEAAREAGLQF